jgi:ATP-binding cassette subfamily B protein
MKLIVDAVAMGLAVPDKAEAFRPLVFFISLAGGVAIVGVLCRSAAGLVNEAQAAAVTDYMHDVLHAKSVEIDLEYYENSRYYDALHRAQQDASFRPPRILTGLVQVGQSGVSLLVIGGLLFSFHWGLLIALGVAAAPGIFVRITHARRMYRWQRRQTPAERRAWYFHWMLTGIEHAKEIRLFDLGPLFRRQFRNVRAQLRRERLTLTTRRAIAEAMTQACAVFAVFSTCGFLAYRTIHGMLTLGDLVMYYQAFQRGQDALRDMLTGLAGLYEDTLFLSNLDEFLNLKPKIASPFAPRPAPRPVRTGIVFNHVSFHYPTGTREVLRDISLTIRPGENIALVGNNGSGKTTLIKLLCRLYDPTEGTITLDGVELPHFDIAKLRREISVIFQDYARYHVTARENIWFGNIDLPPDLDRITAAARYAGADDVIAKLKRGYETTLGKWFEDGEELSIGEWQKVALARAFLREAQIIVLDEPTSALDAKTEYEVFTRFRQLTEGRTTILISHRFSTVRMADRIYVLENGSIVEGGTHEELIRSNGRYAHLFETQAQYYR